MPREGNFRVTGRIERAERSGVFVVRLRNGHSIVVHGSPEFGFTEYVVGESVSVEMTPFDMSQGKVLGKSNEL